MTVQGPSSDGSEKNGGRNGHRRQEVASLPVLTKRVTLSVQRVK